jgi:hypothetical protein
VRVTVSGHLATDRHIAMHRAAVDRGWVSLRGAARLQLDTEPRADRGPHAVLYGMVLSNPPTS